MTDSTDPLIAAAVRPLAGDAEMKSLAPRLLESLREECPGQTEAALKSWNSPVGEKRWLSWRVAFGLTIAVISILLLTFAAFDLRGYAKYYPCCLIEADTEKTFR